MLSLTCILILIRIEKDFPHLKVDLTVKLKYNFKYYQYIYMILEFSILNFIS
jgi:hypothetical protein